MQQALAEMSHYPEYDRVVINGDFAEALKELTELVRDGEGGVNPDEIRLETFELKEQSVTLKG